VKSISCHVPQFAILPGGATYNMNPDQDIIIVEITSEKLVKLLRLKRDFSFDILVDFDIPVQK
jgi:hypothetical protein